MDRLAKRYDGTQKVCGPNEDEDCPLVSFWRLGNEVNDNILGYLVMPNIYRQVFERLAPKIQGRPDVGGYTIASFAYAGEDTCNPTSDDHCALTCPATGPCYFTCAPPLQLSTVLPPTRYLACMAELNAGVTSSIDFYDVHIYGMSYSTAPALSKYAGAYDYRKLTVVPATIDAYLSSRNLPAGRYCVLEGTTYSGTPLGLLGGAPYPLQTDDNQAEYIVRRLVTAANTPYRFIPFEISDSLSWGDGIFSHSGVAHDGAFPNDPGYQQRKSAFYAAQRIYYRLHSMTSIDAIGSQAEGGFYEFSGPNRPVAVLWRDPPQPLEQSVGFGEVVMGLVRPTLQSYTPNTNLVVGNEPVAVQSALDAPSGQYPKIQDAVNIASAEGGGVVRVAAGTYQENVTLPDGVELFGAGRDQTIIEGTIDLQGSRGVVVAQLGFDAASPSPNLRCNGCSGIVSDVRFAGGNPAVRIRDSAMKVARCAFGGPTAGPTVGVEIVGCGLLSCRGNPMIANNLFQSFGTAISADASAAPVVANNTFYQGNVGMRLGSGTPPDAERTRIRGNVLNFVGQAIQCVGQPFSDCTASSIPPPAFSYNDVSPSASLGCVTSPAPATLTTAPEPFAVGGKKLILYVDEPGQNKHVFVDFPCPSLPCPSLTAAEVAQGINAAAGSPPPPECFRNANPCGAGACVSACVTTDGRVRIQTVSTGPASSLRAEQAISFCYANAAGKLGLARWATYGSGSNISADPQFVDPAAGDFRLVRPGSPCIDAGDPESLQNDPDGSRSDMGMYGGPEVTTANAEFATNPTPPRIPKGGSVQFLSTCIGCTQHTWDFGDPACTPSGCNTSDLQAPSHVYENTGLYTVTHTVIDADGMTWSVVKEDLVQVYDPSPSTAPEVVTGLGLTQANPAHVKSFRYESPNPTVTPTWGDFFPYGAGYGVNVAMDDVKDDGLGSAELLTGPGPGPVYGPQVKGWHRDGTPILKINYYAYSTLKYGVNVGAADLDSDGAVEILTGPGPGGVFGPHVRGWDYDESKSPALRPMKKVSFFAYGTLKYGVNAAGANTSDTCAGCVGAQDEIYTGPGPGFVFGPTIRGFGGPPMSKIDDFGVPGWAANFGAKVAGGRFLGGAFEGVVAGKGPGQALDTDLAAFTGVPAKQVATGLAFQPLPTGERFGSNVAVGSNDGPGGFELIFAGTGPGPTNLPHVVGLKVVPPNIEKYASPNPIDFFPFNDNYSPLSYGATVAAAPYKLSLTGGGLVHETISAYESLGVIRGLVAGAPDTRTVDWSLDPDAGISINEWQSDASKASALSDIDALRENLFDLSPEAIVATLESVRGTIQTALLNDLARAEITIEVDRLVAFYTSGQGRTGATVAKVPVDGEGVLGQIVTSFSMPDAAYVLKQEPTPSCANCNAAAHIHQLSLGSLADQGTIDVEGVVHDMATGFRLYAVRSSVVPETSCGCTLGRPFPLMRLCGPCIIHQNVCYILSCRTLYVDATSLLQLTPSVESQKVLTAPVLLGEEPQALMLSPTSKTPTLPAKAYISTRGPAPAEAPCHPDDTEGTLAVVEDLDLVPSSPVKLLSHTTPSYRDLALSPVPGSPKVFAAYDCGLDVIDAATDAITERAVTTFGGDRLKAATGPDGVPRLFALDLSFGTLTSYDIGAATITAQASVPLARDIAVTPSGDRVIVLTGGDGGKLLLFSTSTLDLVKAIPVGQAGSAGGSRIAATVDGTSVLVSDESQERVEVVRIAPPLLSQDVTTLSAAITTVPDSAFSPPNLAQNRRDALVNKLDAVRAKVEEAEGTQDPDLKNAILAEAIDKLQNDVLAKMDGFFGGIPQNDWIHTKEAQELLVPLVRSLLTRLETAVSPVEGPPQTFQ